MQIRSHFSRTARTLLMISAGVVISIALVGCASGGSRIVFTSDRDGNLEIYSVSPSGGDETNLTQSNADEFAPNVSPNRRFVAFLAGGEDRTTLEVMRIDGSERTPAAGGEMLLSDHRWSPDSQRIAFIGRQDAGTRVMMAQSDGSGSGLLTKIEGDEVGDWSRNGESVVFALKEGQGQGIYVRNPDGVDEFWLTNQPDFSPRWSPTSDHIAFLSTRDGNSEVYVMDSSGNNVLRLTETDADEYDIAWSPNGQSILFVSDQDGNPEIYSATRNGSKTERLTYNTVVDNQPTWAPSGKTIAFVSYVDGDADIFVMNSDGTGQRRLTQNDAQDTNPSW